MPTSNTSMSPLGVDVPAAGPHRALNQDAVISQDLLDAVLASDNLARAWKRVKSNNGAPGIDRVSIADGVNNPFNRTRYDHLSSSKSRS